MLAAALRGSLGAFAGKHAPQAAAPAAARVLGRAWGGGGCRGGRGYHFGSSRYAGAITGKVSYDGTKLRKETVAYVRGFDPSVWSTDPMATVVEGVVYAQGEVVKTTDARGNPNGRQVVANHEAVRAVRELAQRLTEEADEVAGGGVHGRDGYLEDVRRLEAVLLSDEVAAKLVGHQAMDFCKQDGVTEIEESVQATEVERKLNDMLSKEEALGRVVIRRHPAFIGCVSNFSNFLDLFRKTLRNIELGVPVIVLSRSNTSQHCYRWFQILREQMEVFGLPPHLVTFASFSIEQQRQLMQAFPKSPCYFTGSREVARLIKEVCPRLVASTGGPNTMLCTQLTPQVAEAVRMSACIENSGQCTALRHLVSPPLPEAWLQREVFGSVKTVDSSVQSLEQNGFFDIVSGLPSEGPDDKKPGYQPAHSSLPIFYREGQGGALPATIEENWRRVYLDVTSTDEGTLSSPEFTARLCGWLIKHQPISLSVNGPLDLALRMWEGSGLAVFSWGSPDGPSALSCQARPQDGECFGEFPPRKELGEHTRFPVIVPTPTPGYNASYDASHLEALALAPLPQSVSFCSALLDQLPNGAVKGFCKELLQYLADAATGPHRGVGARSCLFGLQRPPIGAGKTAMVCTESTSLEDLAPLMLPFYATNARDTLEIIVPPSNAPLLAALAQLPSAPNNPAVTQANGVADSSSYYNVVHVTPMSDFPLVGHFVSLLMPVGHCKSVKGGDDAFFEAFEASPKWLRVGL